MSIFHLSVRIDKTDNYYYPPRDSISIILRILIEKCKFIIKRLVMCEETARITKKVHCHIHLEYLVPESSKVFKSLSQKIKSELAKDNIEEVATLPPRQFSILSKLVKDVARFMRYPLKDQPDTSNTYCIGISETDLEIQRILAVEERQKAIAQFEKNNKKKEEENNTFQELVDYLTIYCPIDNSLLENTISLVDLERIGCKIIRFYKVNKKGKLPFNIDRIIFRYLLVKDLISEVDLFHMMSHIK